MQSRTVILWNDGSGWHRQEMPSGEMGPADRGHPGMGHGRQRAGPRGPGSQMPGWLRQMMGQGGRGPGNMGPRGMGPGGMGPHGKGPGGMGPRGNGPGGMGPHGMGPRGFQGRPNPKPWGAFRDAAPNQEGHGAGSWMKMLGGQPGAAGKQGEMPWMKILEKLGSGEGQLDLQRIQEFLKKVGVDQRGMGSPKTRVRVKVIRPDAAGEASGSEAKELVIEEVIEEVHKR